MRLLAATIGMAMALIGFRPAGRAQRDVPTYGYRVVRSYPHDRGAFTQGLIYRDGFFYEGTGIEGQSGIRKVQIDTGQVLQVQPLESPYFGEGITDWHDSLIQITWQGGVGFVYDLKTFRRTQRWTYPGEGWGLTHDATRIIMSDGTAALRFLDPATLHETRRITVHDARGPVDRLNELEYVKGEILANVWQTDRIARISPSDGQITGWIDLSNLLPRSERDGADVLNGIAYDEKEDRLFVTGKWWPRVYLITLVPSGSPSGGA